MLKNIYPIMDIYLSPSKVEHCNMPFNCSRETKNPRNSKSKIVPVKMLILISCSNKDKNVERINSYIESERLPSCASQS